MCPTLLKVVLIFAVAWRGSGHGAVTKPYPRKLGTSPYCPWCVGEHLPVQNPPGAVHHSAVPSTPCMGTSRLDAKYNAGSYGDYGAFAGEGPSEYKAGDAFGATIVLNADHNGEARWSYCPHSSQSEDEQCFLDHPLTDWVDVHSYWGGPSAGCGEHCKSGEHYPQTVNLPADMPAGPVTLRWLWVCKNTDEVFLSCIDVNMVSGGDSQPSPSPTPASSTTPQTNPQPTPQPTSQPTPQPTPASAPQPAPTPQPASGTCSGEYQQCGGVTWTGATCCQVGWYCKEDNDWHSQCEPESTMPAPQPTPPPSSAPAAQPTTPARKTPAPQPTPEPEPEPENEPEPEPENEPEPAQQQDDAAPAPAQGQCTCARSTSWDGAFGQFASSQDFCSQNFGGSGPFVSAGGGSSGTGSWSGSEPCSSGQYSFSAEEGWQISVSAAQAAGKVPYRAFAYAQLCNGKAYSECLSSGPFSLSFSFKTQGAEDLGAYVKLFFWTDSGSLIGLLPPWHANGGGKLRLITFPTTDYPNAWGNEAQIVDGKWYHLRVDFTPGSASTAVNVFLDGASLGSGALPFDVLGSSSDPQMGVYSFDYGHHSWPTNGLKLWLDDPCLGTPSGTCPSGGAVDASSSTTEVESEKASPLGSCCAAASQQCGGEGFQGPSCCQAGSTCIVKTTELSECVLDSQVTALMERAATSTVDVSLLAGCSEVHAHVASSRAQDERRPAAPSKELPRSIRKHGFLSKAHVLVQLDKLVAKLSGAAHTYEQEEEGEEVRDDQLVQNFDGSDRHEL